MTTKKPMPISRSTKYMRLSNIFSNRYLLGAVFISIGLQLLAVHLDFFQKIFKTVPLSFFDWLMIIGFSLTIIIFDEIRKMIARKIEREEADYG